MKIAILQDIPTGKPTEHFCISKCLNRAINRLGYQSTAYDTQMTTPSYIADNYAKEIIIVTQNYSLEQIDYIKYVKCLKIFWSIDSHKNKEQHAQFCKDCGIELVLVSSLKDVDYFKEKGLTAHWFPNCCPTDLIKHNNFELRSSNVGFCGSVSNRNESILILKNNVSMQVNINLLAYDMVHAISNYKIGWNRNESYDLNFRTFEYAGAGAMVMTNLTPGLSSLFEIGEDVVTYSTIDDCIDKIKYYIKHNEKRLNIAINGWSKTRAVHSYDTRAMDLIGYIERSY